jgi:predicted transcriptional regulator
MINDLPEESSYEDIEYHMYVLHKLREGMADAEAGRVYTQEEVEQYFRKWLVG